MTYDKAIQFLHGLSLFGAHFGLENTRQLAALAGTPQDRLRFIHVAGTNGKGSTCAMLESIYRAAGLRVGLFTSPHLVSFRERMQVDRHLIPESELVRLVQEIQPLLNQFPDDNHLTLFEVVTVMAMKYFAEQKCDLVIWETGLGGRLDATNIVTPLASVITNIALDHQHWLGDTLKKIAAEKAGIIKPGVPVITATDAPEALAVIETIAQEKNAALTTVGADGNPPLTNYAAPCQDAATLPLLGDHQTTNAALALATVEVLQKQIPVSVEQMRQGLATIDWPGRLQLIRRAGGQKNLLDGAHNAAGAKALRAALERHFPNVRPTIIFGALADKDWPDICRMLAPLTNKIIAVPVASERTADPHDLAGAFHAANPAAEVLVLKNVSEALFAAKDQDFLVVTGSLYLVGEALELLGHAPADLNERSLNEWTAKR